MGRQTSAGTRVIAPSKQQILRVYTRLASDPGGILHPEHPWKGKPAAKTQELRLPTVCISNLAGKLGKKKNTDLGSQFPPEHPSPPPKYTGLQRSKVPDWLWAGGAPFAAAVPPSRGSFFGSEAEGMANMPGWGLGAPARHLLSDPKNEQTHPYSPIRGTRRGASPS